MKKIITFFFVAFLSLLGAENKQVAVKSLQKRGEVGNQHYYLPNQDAPFTGKAIAKWPNGQKMTEISERANTGLKLIGILQGRQTSRSFVYVVREWAMEEKS